MTAAKVSVEDLKSKFPVRIIAPYGECIIVPGSEFDPDWEVWLGEKGYGCRFTDLDGRPVTLVSIKKSAAAVSGSMVSGERAVFAPSPVPAVAPKIVVSNEHQKQAAETPKGRGNMRSPERIWRPEEEDLIVNLWSQEPLLSVGQVIAGFRSKFPERTPNSLTSRIGVLQTRGLIKSRFNHRRKNAKHEEKAEKHKKPGPKPERSGFVSPGAVALIENEVCIPPSGDVEIKVTPVSASKGSSEERVQQASVPLDAMVLFLKHAQDDLKCTEEFMRRLDRIERELRLHKHASGSGEAMAPLSQEA